MIRLAQHEGKVCVCCKPTPASVIAKGRASPVFEQTCETSVCPGSDGAGLLQWVSFHSQQPGAFLWVDQPWRVPFSKILLVFRTGVFFTSWDRLTLSESPTKNLLPVVPSTSDFSSSVWFLSPGNSTAIRVSESIGHSSGMGCWWDQREQFWERTWETSRRKRWEVHQDFYMCGKKNGPDTWSWALVF